MKKIRNKIHKKTPGQISVANVSFLNGAPYRALSQSASIDFDECLPSEGARRLFEDEVDLALVPTVEFLSHGGLHSLDFGIAAQGDVESVYFFSDGPIEDITTVVVDSSSRTSVVLLRLYLEEVRKTTTSSIRFHRMTAKEAISRIGGSTAGLLIGDLNNKPESSSQIDLSKWWFEKTGLPFVFALWAYKPENLDEGSRKQVEAIIEKGLESKALFARDWAEDNKLDISLAENYVAENIIYTIGESEKRGLAEFCRRAVDGMLLPKSALQNPVCASPGNVQSIGSIDSLLSDASQGVRLSIEDGKRLVQKASLPDLALAADIRKKSLHPEQSVSYIIDRNINYTNVCNVYCRFCAFYRAPNREGGYTLSKEQIGQKIQETVDAGGIQILLQGGLNPELGIEYYEDLFTWIKANYPINLHALSSDEILHISEVSSLSIEETISRLIAAGLGSLPGGGAELLVDRVRARIAGLKCKAEDWLEVHRTAHRLGITSTCTMMFGVGESWDDRLIHFHKLRQLQDETGGFTAFITWPFQEDNTKLKAADTSAPEYLRVQALSRLFIDNIQNIQSSWVTQGPSIGQVALFYGANDFGSVMFEENVVSAAGTTYRMDADAIEAHIKQAGFEPFQRDVHYNRM